MFEEVPIVIKNSHLINALMWELEDKSTVADKHELLNLSSRYDVNSCSTFPNIWLDISVVKMLRVNASICAIWIQPFPTGFSLGTNIYIMLLHGLVGQSQFHSFAHGFYSSVYTYLLKEYWYIKIQSQALKPSCGISLTLLAAFTDVS